MATQFLLVIMAAYSMQRKIVGQPWETLLFGAEADSHMSPRAAVSSASQAREIDVETSVRFLASVHSEQPPFCTGPGWYSIPCCSVAQSCPALCDPLDCDTQAPLSSTVSRSCLQFMSIELVMPSNHLMLGHPLLGIFLAQGLNPGLLHCRQVHYHLSHQGSPFISLGVLRCENHPGGSVSPMKL